MPLLEQFDLFHGEASHNVAYVYARFPQLAKSDDANTKLLASIHGPHSAHSRTLPFSVKFQETGPGESLLLRAVLPDPCFWSPEVPSLYRVTVERIQKTSGEVVEQVTRDFGIRLFGAARQNLLWENQRWVLRGVCEESAEAVDLAAWREASAACIVTNPNDALCVAASREGVLLITQFTDAPTSREAEIRRLARWPAVAVVVFPTGTDFSASPRKLAPNLLFAEHFNATQAVNTAPWADLAIVDVGAEAETFSSRLANDRIPVIARRVLGSTAALSTARAACDHLQRDLVRQGDYAGYIV